MQTCTCRYVYMGGQLGNAFNKQDPLYYIFAFCFSPSAITCGKPSKMFYSSNFKRGMLGGKL